MTESVNNKNLKKIFIWLAAVASFIGLPAIILSYAVYRHFQVDEERQVIIYKSEMQSFANEVRNNLSAETFFCRLFFDYSEKCRFQADSNIDKTIDFCKKLKSFFGKDIDFLFVDRNGQIKYETKKYDFNQNTLASAMAYVAGWRKVYVRKGNIEDLKKIVGPQFIDDFITYLFDVSYLRLCWADSSGRIPPCGVYPFTWGGFFVFISKDCLARYSHINYFVSEYCKANQQIAGCYDRNDTDKTLWCTDSSIRTDEFKSQLIKSEGDGKSFFESEHYFVFNQVLTGNLRLFYVAKKEYTELQIILWAFLAFLLYFSISYPIIKYIWNTIVLNIPGNASIRLKLGFLFFFAAGIPLLSLFVVSQEYEMHKRNTLIEDARQWSVENILSVDQRFLGFLRDICNDYDAFIGDWAQNLKNRNLEIKDIDYLREKLNKHGSFDFYCIASESKILGIYEGLIHYTGSIDAIKIDYKNSKLSSDLRSYRPDEIRSANMIIKKLCSDLNGTEIPSYILNKLELVAETILQKKFSEIIYSIIDAIGLIREWGFGKNMNMTYFNFISVYDKALTDYVMLVTWRPKDIQWNFVDNTVYRANRNAKGFKVVAYERFDNAIVPMNYSGNEKIAAFAKRATEKPTEEVEILNLDGEDYIAVGFIGRQLHRFCLIGLYPLRNIENEIDKQSSLILIIGLLCILLAAGLAQLLSKTFVLPLFRLKEGALAIENRDFAHRIPDIGRDEFGNVGSIFNNVMVGMEELEIAKIVQESMFPKPEFSQGKFAIYGKSVTMADVGGDYLDFFKIDDNNFSVLLGDVAGHGVGAAVIMAMAKSAVLCGGDSLKSPAAILNQLHKLILASKSSKQRKIMTFQYLNVNSETCETMYGNAGACSPCIIRRSAGTVEELKMSGAALGAFKKAVYKEMPLNFAPGDAIIFYSDGIVEARNEAGEEMGYEAYFDMLNQVYDTDPKKYYENIYAKYLEHIGGMEAQDDLTIIVMVCQP